MMRGALPLLAVLGLAGCLHSTGLTPPSYRQGLIDPEWDPLDSPAEQAGATAERKSLARCRRLLGQDLATSAAEAQRQILRACLGRTPGLDGRLRDRPPRALDLLVFEAAQPTPGQSPGRLGGVVLKSAGGRVEFVYARGTRAELGVLDLRRPDQRRAGGRILNTYLRFIRRHDPAGTRYLAGQLLGGVLP